MANTYTLYTADGNTAIYSVPFPYINRNDVQVYLNNIQQLTPGNYEWLNDSQIVFFGNVIANTVIKIQRSTSPNSADVTFQNGAILTASDLNTATLQNFYRTQELQDELDSYISGGLSWLTTNNANNAEEMIAAAAQVVLNSALLADLQSQIGNIDANAQAIISQASSVATLQATIDSLANINGTGLATYITNETTARISADTAFANTIALLGAQNGANTAFILNMETTQVSPTQSLGDYLNGIIATATSNLNSLTALITANTASITAEQTARANGDSANASSISALQTTVTNNYTTLNAAIGSEATARSSGDSVNASLISALTATVNSNLTSTNAAITNEQTARANGDSANASSITALSTTVAGHTASLATQAATINGLSAEYTVKVDVNGHVAGYGLASVANNGAVTSSFIVAANNFAVVDPGNGVTSPIVPFNVTGGVVYMQNVVIGNALIQNMTISKLTQGSLNADMDIGTGRIVWSNGTNMLVAGVGFGSSSQFIEWFGPVHPAPYTACTESNALFYLKTDGTGYFGGKVNPVIVRPNLSGTSQTETVPYGVTGATILVFGASGGGAASKSTAYNTGGGGGGGFAQKTIAVTPGNTFTYTTGTPGIGGNYLTGTAIYPGTAATTTTFSGTVSGGTVNISISGGGAGTASGGGAGGIASGGDVNINGGAGTFSNPGHGGAAASGGGWPGGNGDADGGTGGGGVGGYIYIAYS